MNRPEILAPVGGQEQLIAAVRCGADAVYFGLQNFNARRNADNFNGENLADTINYCHAHECRVYITINTILFDDELKDAFLCVDEAANCKADAIIVQDFAIAKYAKEKYPNLKLFASTQMAVHNSKGVKILLDYGFSRIVLARELSLKEIKSIIQETGAQTEVFVHGAHCMSLSGNCYLSSMIGGRSGNRGLCAQPCRLDCSVCGRDYALSLKDMSYAMHIQELTDAGVSSLKIEGRMKRAEYVAAAVTACKDALDGKIPDLKTLQAVFSRSGFTDGYLMAKRDLSMFGHRTKEDVVAASDVLKDLAKLYEKENQSIAVSMFLTLSKNFPAVLTITDGENWVSIDGPLGEVAKTLPITKESAFKNLSKLGGSIFYLNELTVENPDNLTMPMSALNDMRRRAAEELIKKRTDIFEEEWRTI